MSDIKVISETPMNLAEVRAELVKIKKRDTELNFRAGKCEDYLNNVCPLSSADADKLKSALEKLDISRLKPEHIAKIIDILPATIEDVKIVFQGYTISVSQEGMKKIAEAVAGFVSK